MQNQDRVTLTVEEAARKLGIGQTLAYELARNGTLPGVLQFGRVYRVSLPALEKALEIAPAIETTSRSA